MINDFIYTHSHNIKYTQGSRVDSTEYREGTENREHLLTALTNELEPRWMFFSPD